MTSADNKLISGLPDIGQGLVAEMTPPLGMRPKVINKDSWIDRSGTLPVLRKSIAADPNVFATVRD